jgi:2-methylaconitate cis-trans-isomerase PrpF
MRLRGSSKSYSMASQTPNPIPSAFIRGGTSKGVFINRKHLPENQKEWARIFQGILGSPDPIYKRQLNGMGGGISSLSKIVVVGPPESATDPSKVDCEYTFVQMGVDDGAIDMAGNCGNLSSMVGCFAIDEGICSARVENGRGRVRSWNTNTKKQIDTVFPITTGTEGGSVRPVLDREEIEMAGVPGKASRIDLEFTNPAGARTGSLLPTGRPVDVLTLPGSDLTEVSLVDATNPTVILPYHEVRSIHLRAVFCHSTVISSATHFAGFGAISRS